MPGLASRLGVTHAALYNYFPSKRELVAALVAEMADRAQVPERDGRPWQEWVAQAADSMLALAREVDGISFAIPLELGGPALGLALVEVLLEAGLSPEETAELHYHLQALALGTAALLRRSEVSGNGRDEAIEFVLAAGTTDERVTQAVISGTSMGIEMLYRRQVTSLLDATAERLAVTRVP